VLESSRVRDVGTIGAPPDGRTILRAFRVLQAMPRRHRWLLFGSLCLGLALSGCGGPGPGAELLNVSYDPARGRRRELNAACIGDYEQETGVRLTIRQSHGGSTSQAGAVIHGLEADVVTLALWSDTDVLRKHHLLRDGWEDRLPNRSLPYYATIVF